MAAYINASFNEREAPGRVCHARDVAGVGQQSLPGCHLAIVDHLLEVPQPVLHHHRMHRPLRTHSVHAMSCRSCLPCENEGFVTALSRQNSALKYQKMNLMASEFQRHSFHQALLSAGLLYDTGFASCVYWKAMCGAGGRQDKDGAGADLCRKSP
jgi:hypothetical protein